MCTSPKWIYKKGKYKNNNYRGAEGDFYELGTFARCGSCEQCMNEKSNNWVVRNSFEIKQHTRKCFITLTYEDSPGILVKKDLQDFIKRFRRKLDKIEPETKIRYFAVGEYGEKKSRPHFHILIYGWDDKTAKYLGINKKRQILYQSKLIQDTWKLGRTSYEKFAFEEIAYISLYTTPRETFKKSYKISREKLKKLESIKDNIRNAGQRRNLYEKIKEMEKEFNQTKEKYLMVREFNTWSIGLGWNEWYKQYCESPIATFTEYVGGETENTRIYATPSPWVKKAANMGHIDAAEEMFKREKLMQTDITNEEELKLKNQIELNSRRKKEVLELKRKQKDEEKRGF